MEKYMNNDNIRNYIYKKGALTGEDRFIKWDFDIFFERAASNKRPGKYIYSDRKGYHVEEVGDRGGIIVKRKYDNIDEVAYDVYKYMIWICAYEHIREVGFIGIDKKELMVNYQLDLMKKIDMEYYNRLLVEFMQTYPFQY